MSVEIKTLREQSREPVSLGDCSAQFLPHYLAGEARVFIVIDDKALNLTATKARLAAQRLTLAADEAEAMQRRAQRKRA